MFNNLKRKIIYILVILNNYKYWYQIFIHRLFNIPINKVQLRSGLVVIGGARSLILDLVDEIFIKKVYNPKFMEIDINDTVMDVGANIGVFSLFAAKMGANKIYSVEPLAKNIQLIKQNFQINRLLEPITIKMAVSEKIGLKRLYLGDIDSHGLLFEHHNDFKKYVIVKTTNLANIFKKYKIKKLDFLKIDCEGSEGEIVKYTEGSTWQKISKVAIEYHDNISRLSHGDIIKILKKNGYKINVVKAGSFFGYIYASRN